MKCGIYPFFRDFVVSFVFFLKSKVFYHPFRFSSKLVDSIQLGVIDRPSTYYQGAALIRWALDGVNLNRSPTVIMQHGERPLSHRTLL